MKIKIPQTGGEKPGSTGKVSPAPPVTPGTPPVCVTRCGGARTPPRRGKSCVDSWKCCDWALLSLIIIIGGGLTFKLIAHKTIEHRMESMFPYHHDEHKQHAECKVVHVADKGMHSCKSASRGMQGDQLQHGWWDWMENGDDKPMMAGWGKNGFFKHPMKKCQKFLDFEKKTLEEFKEKTKNQPEEVVLEEKIVMKELLKKEQFVLCAEEEIKGDIKREGEERDEFEKTLSGKTPEECQKAREEFRRKMEERRRKMMPGMPQERTRRAFNKGNIGQTQKKTSQFPCHEIVVEVNPKGKHRQWRSSEEESWEGHDSSEEEGRDHKRGGHKMGDKKEGMKEHMKDRKEGMADKMESPRQRRGADSHEGGRREHHGPHHPHHGGRRPDEPKPEPEEEMKTSPKDGEGVIEKMKRIGKSWEHKMEEMVERGVHHATLYDSKYTADHHQQCSVSICKGEEKDNKKAVSNFVTEYKKMWAEGETFPCYYHEANKMQVMELPSWDYQMNDREHGSRGHKEHLMKGLKIASMAFGALWIAMIITFCIRRCLQCKRECGARASRYQSQTNEPQVVTVDSPVMSEKEKEAFGEPPVTPRSVWTSQESEAPSAPPSYVTLDSGKPDFKGALDAWSAKQDGEVKKAEEASEA